ncbi:hypothetical protein RB623_19895 [Mesorhizobium sp. LHD-90]|uniref:hypothetical protein n=1 Tax=Mesorhizobium sp. LHD-90 TaxID=3071414 RepID=UPI0027DFBE45|nr:hypothetical protein [Mesorhizobium sp. LHD-90]MDQ6436327.1 hypothetical protein [Mesorhizobium sp. LHD-90]
MFDLRVLEWYRNDPRYYYEVDEIHGRIHQRSGTESPAGGVLRDNLEFLEFGFAYDEEFTRGVAVVRTIRMMLENHPLVRGYEVPDWLREAKVWSM